MSKVRNRVVIMVSDGSPAVFEAILDSYLNSEFEIHFVVLNKTHLEFDEILTRKNARVHFFVNHGMRSLPRLTLQMLKFFFNLKPQVVHAHLLIAELSGLSAAFLARVPMRIHTRHHSDPYHFKSKHARIYDWIACTLSTKIVSTCDNVYEVLTELEKVNPKKIVKIPLCLQKKDFVIGQERIQKIKEKYNLNGNRPIIGMVSRYLEIKGLQYAIPAFAEIRKDFPNACLVVANAKIGSYGKEVASLLETLPADSFREIVFEKDIFALYKSFDIFLHVPTGRRVEAFGQAYTEALACALPCIFTLSGVAPEIARHGENSYVVPFRSTEAIAQGIRWCLAHEAEAKAMAALGSREIFAKLPFETYLAGHQSIWQGED